MASIGECGGVMESGDAEADRIVNRKRSEFGSLNKKMRQIEATNKKHDNYSPN
ncbi:hypothetical protein D3C73_733320 [compost metagenome]